MIEDCENRGVVVGGKKCFCKPWKLWTNCLEVGYCVMEKLKHDGQPTDQPTLFDLEEEECREED